MSVEDSEELFIDFLGGSCLGLERVLNSVLAGLPEPFSFALHFLWINGAARDGRLLAVQDEGLRDSDAVRRGDSLDDFHDLQSSQEEALG